MKVRGRNGKWLGTGDQRAVREVGLVILFKLHARVGECGGKGNAVIVIDVDELGAQHERIGSEDRGRNRRGSVNRKKGADSGKLVADFFFLNIEELSDVLNHLLMGESQLITGRTVQGRRGDDVGGVASAVGRRRQAGRDEDGRR